MTDTAVHTLSRSRVQWVEVTVNEAIRQFPHAVAVFNRYGIDTCCGGAVPIREAVSRVGAHLEALLAELDEAATRTISKS